MTKEIRVESWMVENDTMKEINKYQALMALDKDQSDINVIEVLYRNLAKMKGKTPADEKLRACIEDDISRLEFRIWKRRK